MKKAWIVLALLIGISLVTPAAAPLPFLHVRVVDVGFGLCCLIKTPNNHYVIFDAGSNQAGGASAIENEITAMNLPANQIIDLLVISHQHTDHFSKISKIFALPGNYRLSNFLWTGYAYNDTSWTGEKNYIRWAPVHHEYFLDEDQDGEIYITDSAGVNTGMFHGDELPYDNDADVKINFICGWNRPQWSDPDNGNPNETSIVLRFEYAGRSILLTGDSTGRDGEDNDTNVCEAEYYMLKNHYDALNPISLDSDILVAGHHGSHGSTSTLFLQAVSPEYIIFPAGHRNNHPHYRTAERCIQYLQTIGLDTSRMFRTDLGDNEGGSEWPRGEDALNGDSTGDDTIDIKIYQDGTISVTPVQFP